MTSIENFSNEIFHEIFDYLDGYDISNAFSNLNHRFQHCLHSSSLLFKIQLHSSSDEISMNQSEQIPLLNKHQILSLHFWSLSHTEQFLSTFINDSSLDRLESVSLHHIEQNILLLLLHNFTCLPRLFSLHIQGHHTLIDLTDVYRLSFTLPVLKHLHVTLGDWFYLTSLPIATTKEEFSPIKYFRIAHCCSFEQLHLLLSYTSELYHLEFKHEPVRDCNIEIMFQKPLIHLTYLSMNIACLFYDEFEIFMKKIASKLKIFHLNIRNNNDIYLASPAWRRFIIQHMPQLEKFYLYFSENSDDEEREGDYIWPDEQFTSKFWRERKWIFEAKIDTYEISYSIYPYKKKWYEFVPKDLNSITTNCPFSTLTIRGFFSDESLKLLFTNINWVSTVTTIYHLQVHQRPVLIRTLVDIINSLPDLDSIKIWSLSTSKPKRLPWKEIQFLADIKTRNKVTKVYLENLTKFEEIVSLMDLFPQMKYLQISWTNYTNIEPLVRIILKKIMKKSKHVLHSLCLCIPMADDDMMKNIETLIDMEKLSHDYRIKRVCDQIFLQWE